MKRCVPAVLLLAVLAGSVSAHELRPAYLELRQSGADTYDMLWKVPALSPDKRLALYVRLSEDCRVIIPPRTSFSGVSIIERSTIRRSGGLAGAEITIEGLPATRTDVLVRIEHTGGHTQVKRLTPRSPGFTVESVPGKSDIALTYVDLGVEHILSGIDHLLFVLGLLIIVRGRWLLVKTITAFTVAHSITLGAAVLGFVHVPQSPVEAVIALSILFLATELARRGKGDRGLTEKFPWVVAFVFGCLHGFGFAGALSEIGLPTTDIPLALFTFNAGVEIGQLLFVAGILLLIKVGERVAKHPVAWAPKAAAYGIGTVSAYWLVERVAGFW